MRTTIKEDLLIGRLRSDTKILDRHFYPHPHPHPIAPHMRISQHSKIKLAYVCVRNIFFGALTFTKQAYFSHQFDEKSSCVPWRHAIVRLTMTSWNRPVDHDVMKSFCWPWRHEIVLLTMTSWNRPVDHDLMKASCWPWRHEIVLLTMTLWNRPVDNYQWLIKPS